MFWWTYGYKSCHKIIVSRQQVGLVSLAVSECLKLWFLVPSVRAFNFLNFMTESVSVDLYLSTHWWMYLSFIMSNFKTNCYTHFDIATNFIFIELYHACITIGYRYVMSVLDHIIKSPRVRFHRRLRRRRSANTFQLSGKTPQSNFFKPHMVDLWVWENFWHPFRWPKLPKWNAIYLVPTVKQEPLS